MRVVVVGAGVVGLTCAVVAAERGHQVDVLARDLPLETTSAVAGAWWYPTGAPPRERTFGWALRSYGVFAELASDTQATGVLARRCVELVADDAAEPWWGSSVRGLRRETVVPDGFAAGWSYDGYVVTMPRYLGHLQRRLADAGGTVTRMALAALPSGADAVVDASGLGSRLLAADATVTPVRGQRLLLGPVAGLEEVVNAEGPSEVTYVVPRLDDVVVGGTSQPGEWELGAREDETAAMLARATALVPRLAGAPVLEARVGLRPARPTVRLEREERPGASPVVHCYGHAGVGVTLSWGCAADVADLLDHP